MIQIKKVKPMFNRIITTCDRYEKPVTIGGVITSPAGTIKEYQRVVSIGNTVKNMDVGDVVIIDPTRYIKRKHQDGSLKDGIITDNPVTKIEFPIIDIDGVEHILLYDSDIIYIAEDFEEVSETDIVVPDNTLIV